MYPAVETDEHNDWIKCSVAMQVRSIKLENSEQEDKYMYPAYFVLHAKSPYTGLEYQIVYIFFYGKQPPDLGQYTSYYTYYLIPAHFAILPDGTN